ncbi:hypothetical protein DMB95_03340 [Campylobacter sp. MIT 12-8780]|uniref:hypothetical protein n=1 Tax=unclassified Campylobacter TaxID=2593542 RepID=UPI00115CB1B0|nr:MULTISPECIES: hypothetical protein [unclassified Campylobacter]NDJ26901.1 hypothetical protein [Campylobacter sp. MIT 19-121]TQR41955.1 hypothetical protein DMB95_03340 [Campylobacter sp. MIT 12-8780]
MSMINATLPVQMKVLEKTGYNNYTLLLNHKKVSTKSHIELEVGAEYLAELYTDKGGVITFKNLAQKPELIYYEEGLKLILRLLEHDFDFKAFVIENLINAKDKASFELFKAMLFASYENIYHIPFVFEDKACLFQLRVGAKKTELYLYFSVFGSLKLIIEEEGVKLYTPFFKVANFLSKHLGFAIFQQTKLTALFKVKKRLDFKG